MERTREHHVERRVCVYILRNGDGGNQPLRLWGSLLVQKSKLKLDSLFPTRPDGDILPL